MLTKVTRAVSPAGRMFAGLTLVLCGFASVAVLNAIPVMGRIPLVPLTAAQSRAAVGFQGVPGLHQCLPDTHYVLAVACTSGGHACPTLSTPCPLCPHLNNGVPDSANYCARACTAVNGQVTYDPGSATTGSVQQVVCWELGSSQEIFRCDKATGQSCGCDYAVSCGFISCPDLWFDHCTH